MSRSANMDLDANECRRHLPDEERGGAILRIDGRDACGLTRA
jgi:hypothetical protein